MDDICTLQPDWQVLAQYAGWDRKAIICAITGKTEPLSSALRIPTERIEYARQRASCYLQEIEHLLLHLSPNHLLWLLYESRVSSSDAYAAYAWDSLQWCFAQGAMTLELLGPASAQVYSDTLIESVNFYLEHWARQCDKKALRRWQATQSEKYAIHTSQEWRALDFAVADGTTGAHYTNDAQAMARIHQRPGETFSVRLDLLPDERRAGLTESDLEDLTASLNADAIFIIAYVAQCLSPVEALPANALASAWLDLDDIAGRIGLDARSSIQRENNRRYVWNVLRFASRVSVVGERTIPYFDKTTKDVIPTRLHTPPFSLISQQLPMQSLLRGNADVPLRVQLVSSQAWTRLTNAPDTAQYLPCAELLSGIPSRQPSGSWARVIGIALAHFWRRNSHNALSGSRLPTRRQLLDMFPASQSHYLDVLAGKNPRRVSEYWHKALRLLVEYEFISDMGEARVRQSALPRQGWQRGWLDESVELRPGPQITLALAAVSQNRYQQRPRDLQAAAGNARTRAKKKSS